MTESARYPRPMVAFLELAMAACPADCKPLEIAEVDNSLVLTWSKYMPSADVAAGRVYDVAWALWADLKSAAIVSIYCPANIVEVVFDPLSLDGDRFPFPA